MCTTTAVSHRYKFTSNFDQYLICPSGGIVVGCARHGMGFAVNLYPREYKFTSNQLTIPGHAATTRPLFWSIQEWRRGRTQAGSADAARSSVGAAPPPKMGGGIPSVKMSQVGSRAILMVAW